jgi:hypothetical protein
VPPAAPRQLHPATIHLDGEVQVILSAPGENGNPVEKAAFTLLNQRQNAPRRFLRHSRIHFAGVAFSGIESGLIREIGSPYPQRLPETDRDQRDANHR